MSSRKMLTALALCMPPLAAQAVEPGTAETGDAGALWLNPGFYAYHFQKERNLNNRAFGFGVEYRLSGTGAVTAGGYHNSNWRYSNYVGYYWRPLTLGPVRLGAVFGALNGYPAMHQGGWFVAAIPTASVEYGRVGLNLYYIPSYRELINGSITFQLKLRLF